jgi:hypothetical protein
MVCERAGQRDCLGWLDDEARLMVLTESGAYFKLPASTRGGSIQTFLLSCLDVGQKG